MAPLHIYDRRERLAVRLADLVTRPVGWLGRRPRSRPIRRVLLLRLERIGDLLMVIDAIADARTAWPDAELDLAVGGWNVDVAALLPGVTRIEVASAAWLAREGGGDSWTSLLRIARRWRRRRYDLVVNFEPDIRSNVLAWLTGAPARVGYSSGGGGAFLTSAGVYDRARHVAANARELVARAAGRPTGGLPDRPARLDLPDDAIRRARALLAGAARPRVGIHASGGRESKQWHLDRFAAVARALATTRGATIVLTGAEGDRPMVEAVRHALGAVPVVDISGGTDLPTLAAALSQLDVFVTSDTGPMHVAAAVGTPVVALFGPSSPERYGPLAAARRIVRVDLPCSPCGQVRLPPERCRGHVPDCMDAITVDAVVTAAAELLDAHAADAAAR